MKRRIEAFAVVMVAGALMGCGNSLPDRSLIFATGTTLGVEVSANPSDTTGPVKLVAGYKRFEGVMNPVFYNHRVKGSGDKGADAGGVDPKDFADLDKYYRKNAYSVIAKFEGKATAEASGAKAEVAGLSQWFATGEAATILAESGAAAALTDSPGVAEAVAGRQTAQQILKVLKEEAGTIEQRQKLITWLSTEQAGFDFIKAKVKAWWAAASDTDKDEMFPIIQAFAEARGVDQGPITDAAGNPKPDGVPALIDTLDYAKANHRLFLEEVGQNVEALDVGK